MQVQIPIQLDVSIQLGDGNAITDILEHIEQMIAAGVEKLAELELQRLKEWILDNCEDSDQPQVRVSQSVVSSSRSSSPSDQ